MLVDEGSGEQRAVSGTALLADAKVRTDKGARALVRLAIVAGEKDAQ